ncbi:MAG: glycoside hydrolase family 36 N-terminal domain-containing protein, partial [Acetatifactor sp.]
MGITYNDKSKIFHIFTHSTSYQILLYRNTYPLHLYWGHRIYDDACTWQLEAPYRRADILLKSSPDDAMFSREYLPFEYPCYGTSDFRTPAYGLTDSRGLGISDVRFSSWEIISGKPPLEGLPSSYCESPEDAQTLILILKDHVSALEIALYYTAFEHCDVITRHARITNGGQETIHLNGAVSMSLDMKRGTDQMLQLCGTALRETHIEKRPLGTGITAIESLRGISSHQANPFAAFVNNNTTETQGEVFAVSLVYSGNFRIQAEKDMYGCMRLQAGIHPYQFRWQLPPGSSFTTPEALLVYSHEGLGTMSRCFHRFLRKHISR